VHVRLSVAFSVEIVAISSSMAGQPVFLLVVSFSPGRFSFHPSDLKVKKPEPSDQRKGPPVSLPRQGLVAPPLFFPRGETSYFLTFAVDDRGDSEAFPPLITPRGDSLLAFSLVPRLFPPSEKGRGDPSGLSFLV